MKLKIVSVFVLLMLVRQGINNLSHRQHQPTSIALENNQVGNIHHTIIPYSGQLRPQQLKQVTEQSLLNHNKVILTNGCSFQETVFKMEPQKNLLDESHNHSELLRQLSHVHRQVPDATNQFLQDKKLQQKHQFLTGQPKSVVIILALIAIGRLLSNQPSQMIPLLLVLLIPPVMGQCNQNQFQDFNGNCMPCAYSCLTCSVLATNCTSCPTNSHRSLQNSACPCDSNYVDTGVQSCVAACLAGYTMIQQQCTKNPYTMTLLADETATFDACRYLVRTLTVVGCFLSNNDYASVVGSTLNTPVNVGLGSAGTISSAVVNPTNGNELIVIAVGKVYKVLLSPASATVLEQTTSYLQVHLFGSSLLLTPISSSQPTAVISFWSNVFGNQIKKQQIGQVIYSLYAVSDKTFIRTDWFGIYVYVRIDDYVKQCGRVAFINSISNIVKVSLSASGKLLIVAYNNGNMDVHGTNDGCNYQYKSTFYKFTSQPVQVKAVNDLLVVSATSNKILLHSVIDSRTLKIAGTYTPSETVSSLLTVGEKVIFKSATTGKFTFTRLDVDCTKQEYPSAGTNSNSYSCQCTGPLFRSVVGGCDFGECTSVSYGLRTYEFGKCGCLLGSNWDPNTNKCVVDCNIIRNAVGVDSANKCTCAPSFIWRQRDLTCIDCTDPTKYECMLLSQPDCATVIQSAVTAQTTPVQCACYESQGYKWVVNSCRDCSLYTTTSALTALNEEWKCRCPGVSKYNWINGQCVNCTAHTEASAGTLTQDTCPCLASLGYEWTYGKCTKCAGITNASTITSSQECGCLAGQGFVWLYGYCQKCEGIDVDAAPTLSATDCRCLLNYGYSWNGTKCISQVCQLTPLEWFKSTNSSQCDCLKDFSVTWEGDICTYQRCLDNPVLTATTELECECLYPRGYSWIKSLNQCLPCRLYHIMNPLTYVKQERCKCLADEAANFTWLNDFCVPCGGVSADMALTIEEMRRCHCLFYDGFTWAGEQCFKCSTLRAQDAPLIRSPFACQCLEYLGFTWNQQTKSCYDCRPVSASNWMSIANKSDCNCLAASLYKWDDHVCYLCSQITYTYAPQIKTIEVCDCLATVGYFWEKTECIPCIEIFSRGYTESKTPEACACFDRKRFLWNGVACEFIPMTGDLCESKPEDSSLSYNEEDCKCLHDEFYMFTRGKCIPIACYDFYEGTPGAPWTEDEKCGCFYAVNYLANSTIQTRCSFCQGVSASTATTSTLCACLKLYGYGWYSRQSKCTQCKGITETISATLNEEKCSCLLSLNYTWTNGGCLHCSVTSPMTVNTAGGCGCHSATHSWWDNRCVETKCVNVVSTSLSGITENTCPCIASEGYIWVNSKCQKCQGVVYSVSSTEAQCACFYHQGKKFVNNKCVDCAGIVSGMTTIQDEQTCSCLYDVSYRYISQKSVCIPCSGIATGTDATTKDQCLCLYDHAAVFTWAFTKCVSNRCLGVELEYAGILETSADCNCLSNKNYIWKDNICQLNHTCIGIEPEDAGTLTTQAQCDCLQYLRYIWQVSGSSGTCVLQNTCQGVEPDTPSLTAEQCLCLSYLQFRWDSSNAECYLNTHCRNILDVSQADTQIKCECLSYSSYVWNGTSCVIPNVCAGVQPDRLDLITDNRTCFCLRYLNFTWNGTACKLNGDCSTFSDSMSAAQIALLPQSQCECYGRLNYIWNGSKCIINDRCRGIEPANAYTITTELMCGCLSYLGYKWISGTCIYEELCNSITEADSVNVSTIEGCDCLRRFGYNWKSEGKVCVNCPANVDPQTANNYTCYCLTNHHWVNGVCAPKLQAALPRDICDQYFYWNSSLNKCLLDCQTINMTDDILVTDGGCSCREGTLWNQATGSCAVVKIASSRSEVELTLLIVVFLVVIVLAVLASFYIGKRSNARLSEQAQHPMVSGDIPQIHVNPPQ